MTESIAGQILALLWMIAAGASIGFAFDFYRVLRGRLRPGALGTWLGDALFWFFSTVVAFWFMWRSNFGDFRLYVLMGVVIGAVGYRLLLSRAVVKALAAAWRLVGGALNLVLASVVSVIRVAGGAWRRSWLRRSCRSIHQRLRTWAASDRSPHDSTPPRDST